MCSFFGAHKSHPAAGHCSSHPQRSRAAHCGAALLLAVCLLRPATAAEPVSSHLPRDASLTFPVLLQQSLRQAPEYLALAARDEEARAHVAAARSWLAGRPSLEAGYLDDQPRSATGMSELEYGVQLPLWRLGERRDAAALAKSLGQQTEAWRRFLELSIAGQLRETLAALEAAERVLELEREATTDAQQLVTSVERLFDAGEAAALDVAQTRTTLLAQRRQHLEAEAALDDAEARYRRLTGLAARPAAAHRETQSDRPDIESDHPWLRLLAAEVSVADESVKRARQEAKGNPAVMLGARRQRGSATEEYNDSLLFSLSVPFGGSAHVGAQVSGVKRERAEAEIALKTAQRDLAQRLQETRRELDVVTASLQLSEEQAALDRRQWEMTKSAFEVGEVTLFQVLTALRQSRTSAREHELLKLRHESLIAQFNQTLGVLP